MSIDLANERMVAVTEVPEHLPRRRGKKVHISTIYRWIQRGARGKVLESALLGGIRYTSLEALQRFLGDTPSQLRDRRRPTTSRL